MKKEEQWDSSEVSCIFCGKKGLVSFPLGTCKDCLKKDGEEIKLHIEKVHRSIRAKFSLPYLQKEEGIRCKICANNCLIPEGGWGFCGIRKNVRGKLRSFAGTPSRGWLHYYFDPHPTNCVAEWICPERNHYGFYNLAVFYNACSFDCLYCQNWHFREEKRFTPLYSWREMVEVLNSRTTCICFFGGDPTPQLPHALRFSKEAWERWRVRICWETNGSMNRKLLEKMAEISFVSGGIIKFDLKAYTESIHIALTGVSNSQTLDNFKYLAENWWREDPPSVVASTLLVPGYVEEEEVEAISRFIASLNPEIPYSLLAFYPCFEMQDLPTTSRKLAYNCLEIAKKAGLRRVKIGNIHLLS